MIVVVCKRINLVINELMVVSVKYLSEDDYYFISSLALSYTKCGSHPKRKK